MYTSMDTVCIFKNDDTPFLLIHRIFATDRALKNLNKAPEALEDPTPGK